MNISNEVLERLADQGSDFTEGGLELGLAINLLATSEQLRRARATIAECHRTDEGRIVCIDHWVKRATWAESQLVRLGQPHREEATS